MRVQGWQRSTASAAAPRAARRLRGIGHAPPYTSGRCRCARFEPSAPRSRKLPQSRAACTDDLFLDGLASTKRDGDQASCLTCSSKNATPYRDRSAWRPEPRPAVRDSPHLCGLRVGDPDCRRHGLLLVVGGRRVSEVDEMARVGRPEPMRLRVLIEVWRKELEFRRRKETRDHPYLSICSGDDLPAPFARVEFGRGYEK